jgi:hypothetical protein
MNEMENIFPLSRAMWHISKKIFFLCALRQKKSHTYTTTIVQLSGAQKKAYTGGGREREKAEK